MKKYVVCCDLLRVDENGRLGYSCPQYRNLAWINELFGEYIKSYFGFEDSEYLLGDEGGFSGAKWQIFNRLGLQYEISSWARLYEGEFEFEEIASILDEYFEPFELVLGYELPPYLIKYFNLRKLPYIDFIVHPIRYLDDYMLGMRTNNEEILSRIQKVCRNEQDFFDYARVSKARTARTLQKNRWVAESALFLGQTEVDSSLIANGRMSSYSDVEQALIELAMVYPKVYYKRHPFNKNEELLKAMVSKIKKCEWIDINVYDAFAREEFSVFASLSSGSLIEASYFGCDTRRYNPNRSHFDLSSNEKFGIYYPMKDDLFQEPFWRWLANGGEYISNAGKLPFSQCVKFSLGMQWGR